MEELLQTLQALLQALLNSIPPLNKQAPQALNISVFLVQWSAIILAALAGLYQARKFGFGRWGMTFTPSWPKVSQEQIIPGEVLQKIQTGGRPEIYLGGFVGKEMQESFPNITGLTNRYQRDIVFPDGDIYKAGVGGQGLYISPEHDAVVVYFSTGKQQEEIMARAITESL